MDSTRSIRKEVVRTRARKTYVQPAENIKEQQVAEITMDKIA